MTHKRILVEQAEPTDNLKLALDEIKYESRYGVGRCDVGVVEDLKTKTRRLIRDADYKERLDIVIEAQKLLDELKKSKCY